MATRILGLDIGPRFIRGVVLESQGRNLRLVQLIEEPIELVTGVVESTAVTEAGADGLEETPTTPPTPDPAADADTAALSVGDEPAEDGAIDGAEETPEQA